MSKRILLILIAANLLFIWGNSALPREVSQAFSDWIRSLLSIGTAGPAGSGGSGLLRKIAHFAEFASLGFLSAWFWRICGERGRHLFSLTLLGCLLAACIDETIQLLSPGRGPSLLDVWLDTSGAFMGMIALFVIKSKNMTFGGNQQ